MRKTVTILMLVFCSAIGSAQVTALATGNWSNAANWDSNYVPTSGSSVVIPTGKTVTIDLANAVCTNISITGTLKPRIDGSASGLTVYGNIVVNSGGKFQISSRSPAGGVNTYISHSLVLYGNLTNNGTGIIDFRGGSNGSGTANGVELTFAGSSNSTVSLVQTNYLSSTEEFNGITINKTGGAKVILNSGNLFMSNNASTGTTILTLTSGIIETGSNRWVYLATNDTGIVGGSTASFVDGILGRGMSNNTAAAANITANRIFPVGTLGVYRPIYVRSIQSLANASGHHTWVKVISGNANTGSSSFSGSIDNVSAVRYYEVGYSTGNIGTALTSLTYDFVKPSYNTDDGVTNSSGDLRTAISIDNRATWTNLGPASYTTSLSSPPTFVSSDSINPVVTINNGSSVFISLANATGGNNPLPVELTTFSAKSNRGSVELTWSTATEVNNSGFQVEKKSNGNWSSIGFVEGAGTSNSSKQYSFVEKNVGSGNYSYRLKQIDRDGKFIYSRSIEANVVGAPTELALNGNYPNPFNPATTISFTVPFEGRAVVKVFDLLGKEIATVFNDVAVSGRQYSVPFVATSLPSGIYFSQLEFSGQKLVKKMMLMK